MEREKLVKFYEVITLYKRRSPIRRNHHNAAYRDGRIYNFWCELAESVTWLWLVMQRLYYSFICPRSRSTMITYDRIISLLAFCPPFDTYVLNYDHHHELDPQSNLMNLNGEILLSHFVADPSNEKLKDIYHRKFKRIARYFECFYAHTKYGNRVACIFIRQRLKPSQSMTRRTLVYSHTNAEDIGTILSHLWKMKRKIKGYNLFAYDYSGYGMSSGSPSERNIYADIEAAVSELMRRKGLESQDLILFGESIGSAPTIHLAASSRIVPAGVILQSAFLSGIRIYLPYNMTGNRTLPFDPFANVDRLSKISSPTLVIHGSEDALVSIDHAVRIYEKLRNPFRPFWANGAFHMTVHKHPDYYDRINEFLAFL